MIRNEPARSAVPPPGIANVVSIGLFVHLFVVGLAVASSLRPSPLQSRLLSVLRPYAQALNFDLDFTPFHFTHGTGADVAHRIEYRDAADASESAWRVLTGVGAGWSESAQRLDRFARMAATFAEEEDDQVPAELVRGIAKHLARNQGKAPIRIRVRRHLVQTMDAASGLEGVARRDPNDETYFQTIYEANVLIDERGGVDVAKVTGRGESAQPVERGRGEP
ncbi:MAG: hypothetical protein FJ297_04130 [Planctomycetes bacterium]|nr:hypothetical protein [Planctomycetota bacterium]